MTITIMFFRLKAWSRGISLTALLLVLFFVPLTSFALTRNEIKELLGDYPATGSPAELKDDQILLYYQRTRSKEDCDFAFSQSRFDAEKIFAKPNGPLEKAEFRKFERKANFLAEKVGINVIRAKDIYQRPRPYIRNRNIDPCIPREPTTSYPSGHAATATVIALMLSEYYPDRAGPLRKVAERVALNRVIGGVHNPSDIEAGKKIGEEIYQESFFYDDEEEAPKGPIHLSP